MTFDNPYIQITTRCNMTCAHCCFAATKVGQDMTVATAKKAITLFSPYKCNDNYCVIGGGEPTLNPKFWEIIGLAMSHYEIWMATNGSTTRIALRLAELAKQGKLAVKLSQDKYHDAIDPKVVQAFKRSDKPDFRDKREMDHPINDSWLAHGRAPNLAESDPDIYLRHSCVCSGPFVKPNGDVHVCGCVGSYKLGNVKRLTAKQIEKFSQMDIPECGVGYSPEDEDYP